MIAIAPALRWFNPGVLLLGAGVIVASLAYYWGSNPGYADRFLILLASGYSAWHKRDLFGLTPVHPRSYLGNLLLLIGVLAFSVGVLLLVQIGPRTLLLWWLLTAWLSTTSGWILAEHGYARLRVMAFPLVFTFFALPVPNRILNPLQDHLQNITTTVAYQSFKLIGMTVEREGYVLNMTSGRLGVEEACSGVRSLTALTAIAAFLAYWYGFGPIRGVLLVLGSIPIVATVNIFRVVLSGLIQESFGPRYIVGNWHEALGFAMIFIGLGFIVLLANALGKSDGQPTPVPEEPTGRVKPSRLASVNLLVGLALSCAMTWLGYSNTTQLAAQAPLGELPLALGNWNGENHPVPDVVQDLLAPDVALHRRYRNNLGQEAQVWVFVWNSGASIKGYHHPDVCWGNKGFVPAEKWREKIQGDGQPFEAVAREVRQQATRHTIYYWTQEGNTIWQDADEQAAVADMLTSTGSGHRWALELLGWRTVDRGPRLTVLVMAPSGGPAVRRDLTELTNRLSKELHRLAPWSKP